MNMTAKGLPKQLWERNVSMKQACVMYTWLNTKDYVWDWGVGVEKKSRKFREIYKTPSFVRHR